MVRESHPAQGSQPSPASGRCLRMLGRRCSGIGRCAPQRYRQPRERWHVLIGNGHDDGGIHITSGGPTRGHFHLDESVFRSESCSSAQASNGEKPCLLRWTTFGSAFTNSTLL